MPTEAISLLELSLNIKKSIQNQYNETIWVRAEIAEFREHRNGHCYLDLIEKQDDSDQIAARIRSVIWSYNYRMLKIYFETSTGRALCNGLKVLVQVTVEYHEVFGLSLSITDIDPTFTLGDLEQRKRAIINQLRDEGVLEMNKELQFPIVPQRIAVISSESAAGYGDFVNQIESNHLGIKFYHQIFPAIMQGEQAPASICSAFDKIFENIEDFDVVIIIRGGGASIDLLCFDDYSIAYYITQFPLPVLTGIGHERDNSIADIVANKSLKTPTAVAEYLISEAAEFLDKIENNSKLLEFLTREKLDKQNHKIELLTQQLSNNVKILLKNKEMSLSIISDKTTNIVKQKLVSYENNLKIKNSQLLFYANTFIKSKEKQIEFLERQNRLNNPVEILKKGYTLTIFNDKIVKQPALLKKGDLIKTKFYDGIIKSIVE